MSQAVLDDGDTFLYLGALLLSTLILIIFSAAVAFSLKYVVE